MRNFEYGLRDTLRMVPYLAIMVAVLAGCGWLLAGAHGLLVALLVPVAAAAFLPRLSPGVLMRMLRATPLPSWQFPDLHDLVAGLTARTGLEAAPVLYLQPSALINAFTVGDRDGSAIALSQGAMARLGRRELEGVIAHELAHVTANDMGLATFGQFVQRGTSAVALFGLMLCIAIALAGYGDLYPAWLPWVFALAPTAVSLVQLALSRQREFVADIFAARLTGDPAGLASALEKIRQQEVSLWRQVFDVMLPGWTPIFLRTHPETGERIRRLLEMAGLRRLTLWPAAVPPGLLRQPARVRVIHPSGRGCNCVGWR